MVENHADRMSGRQSTFMWPSIQEVHHIWCTRRPCRGSHHITAPYKLLYDLLLLAELAK